MGRVRYVGIGEMKAGAKSGDLLVAANLGSCLGISAYDPVVKAGGMVHCLLPDSALDRERARGEPGKYVDTGLLLLLEALSSLGAARGRLVLVAVGGSAIGDPNCVFQIGKKNAEALSTALDKLSLRLHALDVGGRHSRTLELDLETGAVRLKAQGGTAVLYPKGYS